MNGVTGAQISLSLAFLAGFLSLVTPCVLALVPAYVTYMTGVAASSSSDVSTHRRLRVIVHALAFVAGFTLIFLIFGASATLIGRIFLINQRLIGKIAGVLVVGFGLHMLGLLHIPGLSRERRFRYQGPTGRPYHSMLIGMAFAAGWTPCVGPILGGILALASLQQTVWDGIWLLFAYSIGMGLPFLLLSVALQRLRVVTSWLTRRYRAVEIVSGLLLLAIGIMLYTDTFSIMARYFSFLIIL